MSRKSRQHKENIENQGMGMPETGNISDTAKDTLDTVMNTVSNNKLLIGGIAAGCGAAIFLFATESGKRIREDIQDKSMDLYDLVSEQVTHGWERLQDLTENLLSQENVEEVSQDIRKVA